MSCTSGSFIDDPTRLLRLARYAGRLGFAVEDRTRALAQAAVDAGALATVSGTRLGTELRLLAEQGDPVEGFARPRMRWASTARSRPGSGSPARIGPALARRALGLLPSDGEPADLVLAVASLDVPAGALPELLDRLAFPAGRRDRILMAATRAAELAGRLQAAREPSEIAAAVGSGPAELVALAGALGAEAPARRWLDELRHVRLEIDGDDLLAAGLEPGPAVGAGLAAARAAKLDGRVERARGRARRGPAGRRGRSG